nr:hypothetical protein [Akkermansiaceae bacterium]
LVDPAAPESAHSGSSCFGTNLGDNYGLDAEIWLRSPPIDLSDAGSATLNYFQFIDIEEGFDSGKVTVLDAGDGSELAVLRETVDGTSGGWELISRKLPAEALGKTIRIEFRFFSDDIQNFPGWYIDDVEVTIP